MKLTSIKNIIFSLIAITLSLIIAFFVSELCIRVIAPQMTGPIQFSFNQELGMIPVPNQHGRRILPGVYDYTYSNNSHGFRGHKEFGFEKTANFRVLFLGDSFTYGVGVNDDQTFAYHIENYLSSFWNGVEVINAANAAKGTDYDLKLFQTLGYKFKPDLVALCFFSNDFAGNERKEYVLVDSDGNLQPKSLKSSIAARKAILINIPGYNWFISWSHVANLLKQAAQRYMTLGSSSSFSDLVVHYNNKLYDFSNHENIHLTNIFITKLEKSVKLNGNRFIIFYIPNFNEVNSYRISHSVLNDEQVITKLTNNLRIKFLSLTKILADTEYNLDMLYFKEGHWTPLAHFVVAKYMYIHIKEMCKKR